MSILAVNIWNRSNLKMEGIYIRCFLYTVFSSDLSYFYGQSRVSLIVVLALLASVMVYAAFHCYMKSKNPYKVIVDEAKPLVDNAQEDGFRIV